MSRPFMIVGFVFLFSLMLFNNLLTNVSWVYMVILVLLSTLSLIFIRKRRGILASVVCLTVTAAYIMMYIFTVAEYLPALEHAGKDKTVVAEALAYPSDTQNGISCTMQIKEISGQETDIKTVAYFANELDIEPYKTYTFKADINGVTTEKDSGKYNKSNGVYLTLTTDKKEQIKYVSSRKTFAGFFENLRKNLSDNINKSLDKEAAGFVNAIFLGDKRYMDEETLESFERTGSSHILAVSGLHMSVWVMSLFWFLRKLMFNEKISAAICIVQYFVLLFLIGFRYSVIRAGIMLIILLASHFFEREPDSKNSLGLAVLLICFVNPFSTLNIGFQMSVFATLGILVIYPPLYSIIAKPFKDKKGFFFKIPKFILGSVATTVSATVMLIPIYIFTIKTFPLISVISNLLIVTLSSVIMVVGAGVSLLNGVNIASDALIFLAEKLSKFVLLVVRKLAQLPYASISISQEYFKYFLIVCFVICAMSLIFIADKTRRIKINSLLCIFALVMSVTVSRLIDLSITSVEVFSKSSGFIVSVKKQDICVVIDFGTNQKSCEAIENYMSREWVEDIDLLICKSDSKLMKLDAEIGEKVLIDEMKSFSLTLDDSLAVNYFSENENSMYLETDSTNIVIASNVKTDYKSLPREMQSADLLICNNKIPQSFNTDAYANIIVSQKKYNGITDDLIYKNAYSTASEGAIIYRCADDGNYEIRGAE